MYKYIGLLYKFTYYIYCVLNLLFTSGLTCNLFFSIFDNAKIVTLISYIR